MRIALHARVRRDRIHDYEQAHTAELLEASHASSAAGGDATLPVAWRL